ncbi:MAG: manganese efflux pump [Clostridiales bacterium]|nr:manganese efflux pump [Clostridiales bacterium]
MSFTELLLIAVGLSMDAFAVALCRGLNMIKINYRHALVIALFFGGFQALMPLAGWLIGSQFSKYITSFDHWVAFVLLAFIGAKMIYEAFNEKHDDVSCEGGLNLKELFIMAVATSIDALAVGITFAMIPDTNIFVSIGVIGSITFALSLIGVIIGNKFGSKYEKKAQIAGGIILILIGLKILLEHLGIISF